MIDDPAIRIGDLIGDRYRLESLIASGGMASVYRARDESLSRDVAIKIMTSAPSDQVASRREKAEVRLLATLSHPSLVTLFDATIANFSGEDRTYLVMELVDGPNLRERIDAGPIRVVDLWQMAADIAEALTVVHAKGIVHRDIKPANILLETSPSPVFEFSAKLADFGIAYLIDATRITATGTAIGTAAYLSPEQATGAKPSPSADIYSFGLVLLESLTFKREFPGPLAESVSARLGRDPVVPGDLGQGWRSLLVGMTARSPEQRPTAAEVAIVAHAGLHNEIGTTEASLSTVAPATRLDSTSDDTEALPIVDDSSRTQVLPAPSV